MQRRGCGSGGYATSDKAGQQDSRTAAAITATEDQQQEEGAIEEERRHLEGKGAR